MILNEVKNEVLIKVYKYLNKHFKANCSVNPDADNRRVFIDSISPLDINVDFTKTSNFYAVDRFSLSVLHEDNNVILSNSGKPLINLIVIQMSLGIHGSMPNRRIVNPPNVQLDQPLPVIKVVTEERQSVGRFAEIVIPIVDMANISHYSDVIKIINYCCMGKRFVCMQELVEYNVNSLFLVKDYNIGGINTKFQATTNMLINASRAARLNFDVKYDHKGGNNIFIPCDIDKSLDLFKMCVYNQHSYKELVAKYFDSLILPDIDDVYHLYSHYRDGIYFSLANYIISTTTFKFLTVVNSSIGKLPDYVLSRIVFKSYDNFSLVLSKKVRSLGIISTTVNKIVSDDDVLVRNLILSLIISGTEEGYNAYQLEYMSMIFPSNSNNLEDNGAVRSYTFLMWLIKRFEGLANYNNIVKLKEDIDEIRLFYKSE